MPCQVRRQRTCTIWQAATILRVSLSTSNQASWPKNTQISPVKQLILRWWTTFYSRQKIYYWRRHSSTNLVLRIFCLKFTRFFLLWRILLFILFYIEFYFVTLFFFVQKITWFFFVLKNYNFCIFRSNNNKN